MDIQEKFYKTIKNNDINNVELLLKNEKINPSKDNNYAVQLASENGHIDIVNLLWQDQRVKDTLKVDDKELYNELIKNDIKEKIEVF